MRDQIDCEGSCSACISVGSCPDRVVCRCFRIREEQIIDAIRSNGVRNLIELRQFSAAGAGCTCCHKELRAYLSVYSPVEQERGEEQPIISTCH